MFRVVKYLLAALVFLGSLYLIVNAYGPLLADRLQGLLAGPFFLEKVSPEDLQKIYEKRPVRILIVPGHDNASFGASFGGVREADLNLELSLNLFHYLEADPKFDPFTVRREGGEYNAWFLEYVAKEYTSILSFRDRVKNFFRLALSQGAVTKEGAVYHNPAADNVSLYLYAVNKVANDYGVDVVLHVHFNDYPRRRKSTPGEYAGFAIYVPEGQLPNARVSRAVGDALSARLGEFLSGSTLPGESEVVVEDQELIAVGSNASRDGASVLVEYAYIYEPQIQNPATRGVTLRELAYLTYLGLKDVAAPESERVVRKATTLLPAVWPAALTPGTRGSAEVLTLQAALRFNGVYPPVGKSLADCPLSGTYGECTKAAVVAFQKATGLSFSGTADAATLARLRSVSP